MGHGVMIALPRVTHDCETSLAAHLDMQLPIRLYLRITGVLARPGREHTESQELPRVKPGGMQ